MKETFIGKRKTAVAVITLDPGNGQIKVNGKEYKQYFKIFELIKTVQKPLVVTKLETIYNITAKIHGGGISAQADALQLAIARSVVSLNPDLRKTLRNEDLLTRDARIVERKKYGLKKARKAPQFSKR